MSGTTLFLVLLVGLPLLMVFTHRGGGHSGMGCGMGHGGHGNQSGHEHGNGTPRERDTGEPEAKPLLGPPGTGGSSPQPVAREEQHHRSC